CLKKAEVKEGACLIGVRYWVAAENIIFQHTGKGPMDTAISRIAIAALPEVGCYAVELSPADRHFVQVGRINRDRALVSGVADDVVPVSIDVYLVADENPMRRDHSRRRVQPVNKRRRIVIFFQWPGCV